MSGYRPPQMLERILEWLLPAGLSGQSTLGDLAEEFERRALVSPTRARLWYAGQTVSIAVYRGLPRRPQRPVRRLGDLRDDLRWSLRAFWKHPAFMAAVIGVLGLGLGANVAVFSVIDGTLQGTSWWADPEATVAVWPGKLFSYGMLEMYGDEQNVYRSVGGYAELAYALQTPDGDSVSVNGAVMTPELFRQLAVQPVLGRALADEDVGLGVEPVAVIGEGLWRRVFGADPAILGERITVSGEPVTVVGIQGAGGAAPGGRAEIWFPLFVDPRDDDFFKASNYTVIGVMRDGIGLRDAHDDLMAFTDLQARLFPAFFKRGYAVGDAHVAPADEARRRLIATPLLLLFGGTALLMLVTALNVGNLLLGRAIDRRRELAVRVSLGAGRGRVVRQLLAEGIVLTAPALGLGLLAGAFGGRWIAGLFVEQAVVATSSVLSSSVLLFALVVAAGAALVVNVVPVVHFLRTQRTGLTVAPGSGAAMQRGLVVLQAALATLLLVSATLLVATVDNLRRVPLGFEPDGMLTVELSTPASRVDSLAGAQQLYEDLVAQVAALPGVESVGLSGWLPLRAQAPGTPINLETAPVDQREAVGAKMQRVDAGFFEVFGIEPIAGRLLGSDERDTEAFLRDGDHFLSVSGVVVNKTLADLLWPDGDAVGQRIAIDPHAWNIWVPVIGVIPDIRSGSITGPTAPAIYVAIGESPTRDVTLVVRTRGDSAGLGPAIQRTVREVDPLVPVRSIADMNAVVRAAYSTAWVMMGLLIVLALLATGLGAVGIYAVLAHHVALNKREIGVRMALGAGPVTVVRTVVCSGLVLALLGIGIGSIAAAASTRFLDSLLFGVSALAPWAFVAPAVALALAAALAAWVPAARAGRLPPSEVLRGE
ncbi:MAG: ABC transporter permease [Acidobacteriota bacterium]|jgi:predicted permease